MNLIKKSANSYILRLQKGGELILALQDFCAQNDIKAAWFQVIGGCTELELAFYNLQTKEYETKTFKEVLEILTISGNIATKENKIFTHAHGAFGKQDMTTIGGHVMKCVISATCEIHLQALDGEMKRGFDEDTGLHLLK